MPRLLRDAKLPVSGMADFAVPMGTAAITCEWALSRLENVWKSVEKASATGSCVISTTVVDILVEAQYFSPDYHDGAGREKAFLISDL